MKIFRITSLAFLYGASVCAAELKEDFESYDADKSINKQGGWGERAYGHHPSCKVTVGKDKQNKTKILSPAGGGDRHAYKHFPKKEFRAIIASKVVVLDFSFKLGTQVELAVAGRYASKSKGLSLKCGNKLALRYDKKMYSGLVKINNRQWNDVRLIIEKTGKDALVTIAYRKKGDEEYIVDPEINKLKLPLGPHITKYWNGINIRIDGGCALDDIVIASYNNIEEVPGKMNKGEVKVSFAPILDHIALPRKAVSLCGKWSYYIAKDGKMPGKSQAWQTLIIPGEHSGLIRSARKGCVFFRKNFNLDDMNKNIKYFACFERVTDICTIYVNGKLAGGSTDGHFPFKVNISSFVQSGPNTLTVKVLGPKATNAHKTRPQGWTWFHPRFSGIPFPVHLERTGDVVVDDVFVKPRVGTKNTLETEVTLMNYSDQPKDITLNTFVKKEFHYRKMKVTIPAGKKQKITLKNLWKSPRLWWPYDPHLYYLTIQVIDHGKVTDAYKQRFGFRELKVTGKDILLNNKRMLHRRNSIIPYLHRSEKGEILKLYKLLKKRGYNGSRLHGGSNLRFIRTADEFGWLIAPESAINEPRGHDVTAAYWPAAREHLQAMVKTFRNNPSVVYWCLSNEFASYYMKGSKTEKAEVDTKMLSFGKMVEKLDPTRTWTCSGDGELGGRGHHGPAPTLSFHYAWQPFKQGNMIPNTVYWLSEGVRPWQRIIWDKKKPIMLSEDLYPPYALKPPHGMASWGGDKAYNPQKGLAQTWFNAYRMLCDGYYHAPVATWNPWGTGEKVAKNPLYASGQLMPDFHIAVKEMNITFFSGEKVQRKIFIYNKLFRDKKCVFSAKLMKNGKVFYAITRTFMLNGGTMKTFNLEIPMPQTKTKNRLNFILTLSSGNKNIAVKKLTYTVYPKSFDYKIPAGTALVSQNGKRLPGVKCDKGVFSSVNAALAAKPANLIIAKVNNISSKEGKLLTKAVRNGMHVLWLEMAPKGWKQGRLNARNFAAFSFVRAAKAASLKNVDNTDLALWRPDGHSVKQAFIKPRSGVYDILTDSSGGLGNTPLMRLYSGKGSWLLCQYPLISRWNIEPAARFIFSKLAAAINKPLRSKKFVLSVYPDKNSAELIKSLDKLKIPFKQNSSGNVLILNGAGQLSPDMLKKISDCCLRYGVVIIDGLNTDNAAKLATLAGVGLSIKPSKAFQLVKTQNHGIMSGLSNSDLYWPLNSDAIYKQFRLKLKGREYTIKGSPMLSGEIIVSGDCKVPVTPAGIVQIPHKNGTIIISTVRWQKFLTLKKVQAERFFFTLLHNLNVNTSSSDKDKTLFTIPINKLANRGFWNRKTAKSPGWFNNGNDDMRYFPVNRTGIDPELKVPLPPQTFPEGISQYAGIDFKLIDPEQNNDASCVVVPPDNSINIPVNRKISKLWLLGALNNMQRKGLTVAKVTFIYSDRNSQTEALKAGIHLNGYQYITEVEKGIAAWIGRTPKHGDAVLWCWSIDNPYPNKQIKSIKLSACGKASLALIAITGEN
jgi:glycosyl hydrolase family 2